MAEKIKKIGSILFIGIVSLLITNGFESEIILKLNNLSTQFSFLNPNIILNLIGYSLGDFFIDLIRIIILIISIITTAKVASE